MLHDKRILAIVPARGGSKGLPEKNLKKLLGKPLVVWAIEAGKAANSIDSVIVSTDDERIASVAHASGARVPFMRPTDLASDTASSVDVVLHAIDHLEAAGEKYDIVVLLEPTSPLRDNIDIEAALDMLINSGADSVVGISRVESSHPSFTYRKLVGNRIHPFLEKQPKFLRRQDVEPLYFLEGSIYASSISALRELRSFYHENTIGYEFPKWKSLEIDDLADFYMVEALLKHSNQFK